MVECGYPPDKTFEPFFDNPKHNHKPEHIDELGCDLKV